MESFKLNSKGFEKLTSSLRFIPIYSFIGYLELKRILKRRKNYKKHFM